MIKVGFGRDIHAFSDEGRDLIIGGIKIPFEKKVLANSDGDVLFHALAEALLGSLGMFDLGTYFPETKECENMDSSLIVKKVLSFMHEKKFHLVNVDISLILEKPRLKDYILKIKNNVKNILNLDDECVSIKAQTNEKMDSVGKNLAIESCCALLIESD